MSLEIAYQYYGHTVCKFQGTKVPGSFRSGERKFQGTRGPGSEWAREQKGQRGKVPGSELAMVLLADSLRGAKCSSEQSGLGAKGL